MKNIINLLILFFLATACTERIDLELNEGDNEKLVVDAWITNELGPHKVKLTLSTSYFHNQKAPTVSDAKVEISDGLQTISLMQAAPGEYWTPADFKGAVGKTYTLTIQYKEQVFTSTATLNRVPKIDGLDYTYEADDEIYSILIFTQEPAGIGDFYLFKTYKNGTLMGDTLRNTEFVEDELVDGNYIEGAEVGYGDFVVGDTITHEIWSISEEAYDFFTAINLETVWRGGIFDAPPANIPTNIKGGALGFFNASAVERGTLVIED